MQSHKATVPSAMLTAWLGSSIHKNTRPLYRSTGMVGEKKEAKQQAVRTPCSLKTSFTEKKKKKGKIVVQSTLALITPSSR